MCGCDGDGNYLSGELVESGVSIVGQMPFVRVVFLAMGRCSNEMDIITTLIKFRSSVVL